MKEIHEHVMGLHKTLFSNISDEHLTAMLASEAQCLASSTAAPAGGELQTNWTSHTLAWKAINAQRAVWLVGQLKSANIEVDRCARLLSIDV